MAPSSAHAWPDSPGSHQGWRWSLTLSASKPGSLGLDGLPHEGAWRELLRCELDPVAHARSLPRFQPSTPVALCGAPTGFDSGEPRWRRYTARIAIEPTARNSDCQFSSVFSQKCAVVM